MNQSNAQGNESEGVAFFIVEVDNVRLANLAHEIEKNNCQVDCGKKVPENHGSGIDGKENHAKKYDRTDGETDYLRNLLRVVESLQADEEEERRPVLVYKKKTRGKNEIQDAEQIELYHITYLNQIMLYFATIYATIET